MFRFFTEIKKNGGLGRETIVRKTMLDDCKGDKFDELLAVFSTAVVRKELASTPGWIANPVLKLSVASEVSTQEYQMMVPLILAHRVSLSTMGDRRARIQVTHDKFTQLLDTKREEASERSKGGDDPVPTEDPVRPDLISHEVKENWLGNEEWADALLYGGSHSSTDAFLELPFSQAWARANQSTVENLSNGSIQDLVANLESRVSHQHKRLNRWREFCRSIQRDSHPARTGQKDEAPLVFRDHQALSVVGSSKDVHSREGHYILKEEDEALLSSMHEALAGVSRQYNTNTSLSTPLARSRMSESPSALLSPRKRRVGVENDTHFERPDDEPDAPRPPEPDAHITAEHRSESHTDNNHDPDDISPLPEPKPQSQKFTLAERTRKSMSLVPPSRAKPPENNNPQHHPHHRSRKSFPVNQFETPQKHTPPDNPGKSTPPDDLFGENADYASVFKSRPRVAQSPVASPAVHISPLDEFDLDGGSNANASGHGSLWDDDSYGAQSSPLFSRVRIR